MGLFSKERHGRVTTVRPGREFRWDLPNFMAYANNTVLDSDLLDSWQGIEFHFHCIIGFRGDVGFYIHHKKEKIPKYSFLFACEGTGQRMRQHTAHTIPQDTERCGHWNVATMAEIKRQLFADAQGGTLSIHFTFDNDALVQEPTDEGAMIYRWHIPAPTQRVLTPFTSSSFHFNGVFFILRLDKNAGGEDTGYSIFVFSRTSLVPPHELALHDRAGGVIAHLPRTEDMTTQILKVPQEALATDRVTVVVTMHRGGNPLDMLNNPNADLDAKPTQQPSAEDAKARKYGVAMEDI